MVAYTLYESDNRVRRYAEILTRAGFKVDVLALRGQSCGQEEPTLFNGVSVYHLMGRVRNEKTNGRIYPDSRVFFMLALFKLTTLHLKHRYALIHVHNMPDFSSLRL